MSDFHCFVNETGINESSLEILQKNYTKLIVAAGLALYIITVLLNQHPAIMSLGSIPVDP